MSQGKVSAEVASRLAEEQYAEFRVRQDREFKSDFEARDHVIAHELTHLLRHDDGHSPAFWAQLGRTLPDYEARRARLRNLGPWLQW